jgi:multidrug resistance protein MdtO
MSKDSSGAESWRASFFEMLWDALKPFPGRGGITLRLAIVCTAVVLVADTFRLPFQDLMPFFILFITKEEKVTTAVSALLVLVAVTLAIGASILLFKCTGNRAEFRIPGIAAEIFVGMYLFRVLAIGPVGWILGFICAASQSLVYLSPDPEETVHQFLWLWVAIAFPVGLAWVANLLLFPVSPARLLQHEFMAGWQSVAAAAAQLTANSPSASATLLGPLAKRGPIRFLKLLKLSLLEVPALRARQGQLTRVILSLDKITKLLFSYARARLRLPDPVAISPAETALLGDLRASAQLFEREFEAGLVPPGAATRSGKIPAGGFAALQLVEAANTVEDLAAANTDPANRPAPPGARARQKRSLFVADAFRNPRHVQFALKVTLAGIIGYLFYTASDYYGIHTVFYTPLIIALASTGASIHKGVLRIVGCIIGGALGLICLVWVIPRCESLGAFLLIIFCVHGLAAWIALGSERISYLGLQVALAFDLGVLQGYGPPTKIDPLRDRFIGIILGICILSVVFSLFWPESAESMARERLAVCLRAIARLLRLGRSNDGSPGPASQREQVEVEIASRLSEVYAYEKQAVFEALLYGSGVTAGVRLEEASAGVEDLYVACLPWVREQASLGSGAQDGEHPKAAREMTELLAGAVEECADLMGGPRRQSPGWLPLRVDRLLEKNDRGVYERSDSDSLKELSRTLVQLRDQLTPSTSVPGSVPTPRAASRWGA